LAYDDEDLHDELDEDSQIEEESTAKRAIRGTNSLISTSKHGLVKRMSSWPMQHVRIKRVIGRRSLKQCQARQTLSVFTDGKKY
jgi:hypothetical protein